MFIGFDIGGTNIKSIFTDREGNIIDAQKTPTGGNRDEIISNINRTIDLLLSRNNTSLESLFPVGIGVAGAVNSSTGHIVKSPNIAALDDFNLAQAIGKHTGKRVYVINDATAALMGEWWKGHGQKYSNWLMLTLGTGIGGGAIVDNHLLNGRDGYAAEFGHMTIDINGIPCSCGNRGCFERYASASSIAKIANEKIADFPDSTLNSMEISSESIYSEAKKRDAFAMKMMKDTGHILGMGIVTLINAFNPEAIVLAGGLSHAHDILIPIIKQTIQEYGYSGLKENIQLHLVTQEDKGPSLGAIKYVLENDPIFKG